VSGEADDADEGYVDSYEDVSTFDLSGERERDVFRALLKVNDVGARVALAILSGMDGEAFSRCVAEGDTARLTRLPGIGSSRQVTASLETGTVTTSAGGT